jgi:hypothetical protein
MLPPWQKHPEIPSGSIGWRMGYGDAYWANSASGSTEKPGHKRRYAEQHPEPPDWENFYARRGVAAV